MNLKPFFRRLICAGLRWKLDKLMMLGVVASSSFSFSDDCSRFLNFAAVGVVVVGAAVVVVVVVVVVVDVVVVVPVGFDDLAFLDAKFRHFLLLMAPEPKGYLSIAIIVGLSDGHFGGIPSF